MNLAVAPPTPVPTEVLITCITFNQYESVKGGVDYYVIMTV